MNRILTELEARRNVARMAGGQKRIDAQHAKGKLTAQCYGVWCRAADQCDYGALRRWGSLLASND